jgi:hypothetical protein
MDQDDVVPGGPRLDRQERPTRLDARGRPLIPGRVPETRPTPLQAGFIYLSIVVLVCGVVAIASLELGSPLAAPQVRFPVLIGGAVLVAITLDAIVRIWRSAWAWMPVDRGRGWFRMLWVATLALSLLLVLGAMLAVVGS